MSQYVLARIVRMDGVDIGLFDYDRYNTLYYFMLNADEQIYMRYGGRDATSATAYLDLESLELALAQGLELHERQREGRLPAPERPAPLYPHEIPALYERTTGRGACVECHLIGDLQNVQRERDGELDRVSQMYRSPDIKTIGIHLDVPRGLVVKQVLGAVAEAGMAAGDRISALEGKPVWSFGDLQDAYDKVDRSATALLLEVDRGGELIELEVTLPDFWWVTDLQYRHLSVNPRVYFKTRPLTAEEKSDRGLDLDGFAAEVTYVDSGAQLLGNHELARGDIVFAVDGEQRDPIANTPELHIKLRKGAGDTLILELIRDAERMTMPLKTDRLSFRK